MASKMVKIKGLKELDRALSELPRATAKNVGKRVLMEAGEPIARTARRLSPNPTTMHLYESIDVGTKLTSRQKGLNKKPSKDAVEVYVGTNDPGAVAEEFGWEDGHAQPFMRPAWDAQKDMALTIVVNGLEVEIEKAAARARRKALKAKG